MAFDRIRQLGSSTRVLTLALARSHVVADSTVPGVIATIRAIMRGATGPSAIFRIQGAGHPDRAALEFAGRSLTFREIDERIDELAAALAARGLGAGDGGMLMLRNRPEWFEIGAAMMRLGGAVVAVPWHSTAAEIAYVANHSGARALFFEADLWPVVDAARREPHRLDEHLLLPVAGDVAGLTSVDNLRHAPPTERFHGREREGALIIYTSGTTGKPKGAVRRFAARQIEGWAAFVAEAGLRARDRHLCVCPLYHSKGLAFAQLTLILGGTVILQSAFDPEGFLAAIEREQIQTAVVVPTMLHRIMALPEERMTRYDVSSLRALFCSGAQLPSALAQRTLERLGPLLYNFYAATEAGLVTLATPDDLRAAPGTIGRPLPRCEVRLLNDAGHDVPDRQVGELFVRNSILVEGYHADPDATRASRREGFISVGDLAIRDPDGRIHLVGRKADMVISGGVNIYPMEIEQAIESHPGVLQAAVIGVPDEEWGERLRAFVVPHPGHALSGDALRAFCREKLSSAKVPREWVFADALPTSGTGKVLKRELRLFRGDVERV